MAEQRIPLPKGLQGLKDFPRQREGLFNMMRTKEGNLIPRPGVELFATGNGPCRGQHKFQNMLYQVSDQNLILIEEDSTVSNVPGLDITSTQECAMAADFSNLVIVVKGDRGYFFDGVSVQEITDPDYLTSVDVDIIAGRAVYIPEDGGPAFFSDEFAPNVIQPLSFFDAETQPDFNKGVINIRERLYILGAETTEPFRYTGTGTVPFQRIEGGSIWTGYAGGKVSYLNSFAFLGKDKNNNFGFFIMGSGSAQRISNGVVDEILNEEYTLEELESCIGNRFQWKNEDVAIFRLPRHCLAFNGQGWLLLESLVDGETVLPWETNYIDHVYGDYYTGTAASGKIGKLSEVYTDFGARLEFGFDTFVKGNREDYFTLNRLTLDGVSGQQTPQAKIGLQTSEDGKVWGPRFFVGLGNIGERDRVVSWEYPGGLGDYESFAGLRIRCGDPVNIASEGVLIDI